MTYTRFQVPIFHNTQNTLYSEDNKLKQISFVDSCVDMFLFCGDKSLEIGMKIDSIKALLDIPWTNDIENITAFDFSEKIVFDFDTGEILNITTGKKYQAQPFPEFIQNIIKYLDHILSGDSDLGITTQYFYATFEKAVRKFFHDKNHDTDQEEIEKNLKEGLPKATWNFKINGNLYPSNRYL